MLKFIIVYRSMIIFSWMILIHKGGCNWQKHRWRMDSWNSVMISVDLQSCSYPVGSTGVFNSHGKTSRGLRNIFQSNASKISSPILYGLSTVAQFYTSSLSNNIQQYWAFQQGRHPHADDHWSLVQLGRLSGWSSCWRNWCNSLSRTRLEMHDTW
jgi:hypothetical protein